MYNKRICLGSGNQNQHINVVDYKYYYRFNFLYSRNYHKQEVEILNVGYENPITMKNYIAYLQMFTGRTIISTNI